MPQTVQQSREASLLEEGEDRTVRSIGSIWTKVLRYVMMKLREFVKLGQEAHVQCPKEIVVVCCGMLRDQEMM
jgi:hypothetical protein